jgi:hypothetical protein
VGLAIPLGGAQDKGPPAAAVVASTSLATGNRTRSPRAEAVIRGGYGARLDGDWCACVSVRAYARFGGARRRSQSSWWAAAAAALGLGKPPVFFIRLRMLGCSELSHPRTLFLHGSPCIATCLPSDGKNLRADAAVNLSWSSTVYN